MMIIISNKDDIKFKAENVVDGMKIGIIKEKLSKKGIPVIMGFDAKDNKHLELAIKQKDLLDLLL